jgi:hypothetical protein
MLRQVVGSSAAGDDLDPEVGQSRCEFGQPLLVERG